MELEHKLVEDRDAAHAEAQQREDLEQRGDDQLPEPIIEAVHDATRERRAHLLGTIRMILDQQQLEISRLDLPARETRALAALQVAVTGRDELGEFVYAEDRHDLLERALGVLQPDVTHVDAMTTRELHAQLADLSERVADLRHTLSSLEDAQDEIFESHQKEALAAAATPKPPPADPAAPAVAGPDAPERAPTPSTLDGPDLPDAPPVPSTLAGPDAPERAPAPSTLTGPELPDAPPVPSTLAGPDAPERAPTPSTLDGPELPDAPPVPSTLAGPDLPDAPPAPSTLTDPDLPDAPPAPSSLAGPDAAEAQPLPSTLGDAAEIAQAQARKPWWRRPFG